MSEVILNDSNFDAEILQYKGVAMVDFWAPWCGPCRMLAPVVGELAAEYDGKVRVAKLNVDEAPDASTKYGVVTIPTIIFFKDGKVVAQTVGLQTKTALQEKLNSLL